MLKLISWNVNGLRACLNKGFLDYFHAADADVFCLQETKMQPDQAQIDLPGYQQYWNSALKKGYSGTAVFTRLEPLSVQYGIGAEEHEGEGRAITLEFPDFYLVTVYTPNAQRELARIDYRMEWEDAFRANMKRLDEKKKEVTNRGNAGFSDQERGKMTELLDSGFIDTFRWLHPDATGAYTWWSYMFHAREKNAGWRIDYFLVSERLRDRVQASEIHAEVMGSDHCPVELLLQDASGGKRLSV